MIRKLSVFLLLLITETAFAASANDLFFKANKQYDTGNYQEAVDLYEKLVLNGVRSGSLYYNLGNTYFRLKKKGKALVNYERAKVLIPNDEDLKANYEFLSSLLNIKQLDDTYSIYKKIYFAIRNAFSIRGWFFISLTLFLSVCFLLGISIFNTHFRKKVYMPLAILGLCFFISTVFFLKNYQAKKHIKMGMVIVPKTEVRYSPSYSGAVAFELTEGTKAQILKTEGEWTHIRLNSKNSGWVETEVIEKI